MSSATGHFLIAAALALPASQSRTLTTILPSWLIPVVSGLLAAAPDLDLAGHHLFDIPENSVFSHRGFFHSPLFAILFSAVLAAVVARGHWRGSLVRLWLLWAGCMITHPLLDALSNGGDGVMLFLPFSHVRFFFPWRPLYTPPASVGTVVVRALLPRLSEMPFCCAAVAIGVSGLMMRRRFRAANIWEHRQASESTSN